jgi:hypothetical protein
MHKSSIIALAGAAALVAGAAAAADEHLVVKPYPGSPAWKRITDKSGPQGWIHEQIPGERRDDDYSDMLTDQAFAADRGADPSAFLRNIFAQVGGACAGVRVSGPLAQTEGGLRVAYGQVRCGAERGQAFGVHIFYKAISGDAALYSISREFRVPASAEGDLLVFPKAEAAKAAALLKAETAADQYLQHQVYVCGGRSTEPRCGR